MYRKISLLALLLLILTASSAFAEAPVDAPICEGQECSFHVEEASDLAAKPCRDGGDEDTPKDERGYTITVAYNKANGATAIFCVSHIFATDREFDMGIVYDRNDSKAKPIETEGGDFTSTSNIEDAGDDSDNGSGWCRKSKKIARKISGDLHYTQKEPGDAVDGYPPYCYSIFSIFMEPDGLKVKDDQGQTLPYASEKIINKWAPIRAKLAPYIAEAVESTAWQQLGVVTSQKAKLFTGEYKDTPSKMYLVKGDKIELINTCNTKDDKCFVRYIKQDGRPIEEWVQQKDIEITESRLPPTP